MIEFIFDHLIAAWYISGVTLLIPLMLFYKFTDKDKSERHIYIRDIYWLATIALLGPIVLGVYFIAVKKWLEKKAREKNISQNISDAWDKFFNAKLF